MVSFGRASARPMATAVVDSTISRGRTAGHVGLGPYERGAEPAHQLLPLRGSGARRLESEPAVAASTRGGGGRGLCVRPKISGKSVLSLYCASSVIDGSCEA